MSYDLADAMLLSSGLTSVPLVAPPGPSGATAQTSGFAEPTQSTSSGIANPASVTSAFAPAAAAAGSFGGGLASSPNVPQPGTTIDPATGKPHVAGMTRAELEAKKAMAAGVDVGPSVAGPSGTSSEKELPGSWGRE